MVAANVTGLGQAWQANANTRINAAAAVTSAARGAAAGRPALTVADKIELMGVPQTQSNLEEESAADEIQLRLQRMTELAELSASDELEDADRMKLQEETEAIKADIDRIAARSAGSPMAVAAEPAAQAEGSVADIEINSVAQDTTIEKPVPASWSGTLDPLQMTNGTTITVNDITFEFVIDPASASDFNKIDISGCSDGAAIAQKFADAINNDETIRAKFKAGWEIQESNLPKEEGEAFGVSCTWSKDDAGTWTLKFEQKGIEFQEETKLHEGNGFSVRTGSTAPLGTVVKGSSALVKRVTLKGIADSENSFILQVDDAKINVKVKDTPVTDVLVWDGRDGEMKSGTLYVYSEAKLGSRNEEGSLANGIDKILDAMGYAEHGYGAMVVPYTGTYDITISGKTSHEAPELGIFKDGPELSGVSSAPADENKAYLEFEVDLDNIKNGDSFNFRGMEFVFGTNDGTKQGDNFVYIPIDTNPTKTAKDFQKAFNDCFATEAPPRTDEIAPSTGYISSGATNAGRNEPWYENLKKLLASGVFEMRCFIRGGNTAVFSIYAKNAEVLNSEGKIELSPDEGEGWKAVESSADAPAEPSADGGTSPDAPAGTEGEPAATSSEALGISSVNVATRSGAAQAVSVLSAAGDKLSAAKAEAVDSAEDTGKLRNEAEAAQTMEKVKGQLEADSVEGVKVQSGGLEAGTAVKLTQD